MTDLGAAHVLALESLRAGGPIDAVQSRQRKADSSVRDVVSSVERVTGRKVSVGTGPRRAGDPGVLFASSEKIRRELGWTPRYEALDVIVETAWRWRDEAWDGYADRHEVR